jgi:3-dehydroquinate synthase
MTRKLKFKDLNTQVIFLDKMIKPEDLGHEILWIVDKVVLAKNPHLNTFFKQQKNVYKVEAGEKLKDIFQFPDHIKKILELIKGLSHHHLVLAAVGGGSVGDFSGFVASTLKRGVRFVQVPTTWLAAIDSAHGGKNALNVSAFKNQIGTFYHPEKVFIIKEILNSQPKDRLIEALGEIYKMALIDNQPWGKKCLMANNLSSKDVDEYLANAIKAKYKIVQKDPKEQLGIRFLLNFGHTLAHALELEFKIPHGIAVSHGLKFALWLSFKKGFLNVKEFSFIENTPMFLFLKTLPQLKITSQQFKKYLSQDKKKDKSNMIRFVFLKKIGFAFVQSISIDELSELLVIYQNS